MSIEFKGLNEVLDRLDKAADTSEFEKALNKACLIVERAARQKAPKGSGSGGEGLAGSIRSDVINDGTALVGKVYSNLEYAPYIEYGTGKFREENPSDGYWVYVRNSYKSGVRSTKRYSLEDAKWIVAVMRSEGLDAIYTNGQRPQPFMRPALNENRQRILDTLKGALKID